MKNNINKYICGIVALIFTICLSSNVYAADSTCVYNSNNVTLTVNINEGSKPTISIKTGVDVTYKDNKLVEANFQDLTNKVWKCPQTLYYTYSQTDIRKFTFSGPSITQGSFKSTLTLDPASSTTGHKLAAAEDETYLCNYGNLVMTVNKTKGTVSGTAKECDSTNLSGIKYADLNGACPSKIHLTKVTSYASGYKTSCSYSTKSSDKSVEVALNGSEPIIDAGGESVTSPTVKPTEGANFDTDKVCPLGPEVTKDLQGVLKVFNIVAPLLVIVLSTMDAIKAITKGDAAGDLKKVAIRFGKRAALAAVLFFLPIIVNQLMIMLDFWDAAGGCTFE